MRRLIVLVLIMGLSACTFTGPTLPPAYDDASWQDKLDTLWNERVLATEYAALPPLGGGGYADRASHVASLASSYLQIRQMHEHVGDEMPAGRHKVTHAFGVMARVELVVADTRDYGGVLSGASGLARFAIAAEESLFDAFIPAMAIKFPVSGGESIDVLVTESLPGQGRDRNFFARRFSNVIPPLDDDAPLLLSIFAEHLATEDPEGDGTSLQIGHVSQTDQDGQSTAGVEVYELAFTPTDEVKSVIASDSTADFREDLQRIEDGTVLYNVSFRSAHDDPSLQYVGQLVLRSRMVASEWGDRRVFFRHHF